MSENGHKLPSLKPSSPWVSEAEVPAAAPGPGRGVGGRGSGRGGAGGAGGGGGAAAHAGAGGDPPQCVGLGVTVIIAAQLQGLATQCV